MCCAIKDDDTYNQVYIKPSRVLVTALYKNLIFNNLHY